MKPTKAHIWHDAVFERDGYSCNALTHDHRCTLRGEIAHHIVYRRHLTIAALWLLDNGITLSTYCHIYTHSMHNLNLSPTRLVLAVDAVNLVQGDDPAFHRPYFESKGIVLPLKGTLHAN